MAKKDDLLISGAVLMPFLSLSSAALEGELGTASGDAPVSICAEASPGCRAWSLFCQAAAPLGAQAVCSVFGTASLLLEGEKFRSGRAGMLMAMAPYSVLKETRTWHVYI